MKSTWQPLLLYITMKFTDSIHLSQCYPGGFQAWQIQRSWRGRHGTDRSSAATWSDSHWEFVEGKRKQRWFSGNSLWSTDSWFLEEERYPLAIWCGQRVEFPYRCWGARFLTFPETSIDHEFRAHPNKNQQSDEQNAVHQQSHEF